MVNKIFWSPAIFLFLGAISCLADTDVLKAPIHFKDYQEIFNYISGDYGQGVDSKEVVLEFAADSRIDYLQRNSLKAKKEKIAVITADYIDKHEFWGISHIRGAQGNGLFYVIEKNGDGYDIIGILSGNSYRYTEFNGKETFITTWHMSASQFNQCLYQWDGMVYKLISSKVVEGQKYQ